MKNLSIKEIAKQTSIIRIAEDFGITLTSASSGSFDFKCKCPSSQHKNGNERTDSCYLDSKNNSFYCFGCSAGTSSINFYMLCADVEFSVALSELQKKYKYTAGSGPSEFVADNFSILFDLSNMFRETILKHPKDLKWIDSLMKAVDVQLHDLKNDDLKHAKRIYKVANLEIKKRYSK